MGTVAVGAEVVEEGLADQHQLLPSTSRPGMGLATRILISICRGILAMLDVPLPEIEPADIRIYAEEYFNLNRKGMFGKKTSVDKVLKWKNVRAKSTPVCCDCFC